MRALKVIGNCCLVLLAIISVCISLVYAYVHFFVKDITVGTNYIDNQIAVDIVKKEDMTEEQINEYEERYFMEANFYSNAKNNGIALQELKFNYFTDYSSAGASTAGSSATTVGSWFLALKSNVLSLEIFLLALFL